MIVMKTYKMVITNLLKYRVFTVFLSKKKKTMSLLAYILILLHLINHIECVSEGQSLKGLPSTIQQTVTTSTTTVVKPLITGTTNQPTISTERPSERAPEGTKRISATTGLKKVK